MTRPDGSGHAGHGLLKFIDLKYLDVSNTTNAYRLESYRSHGNVTPSVNTQIRCYFVAKCDFVKSIPSSSEETDIHLIGRLRHLSRIIIIHLHQI
ncbi:unnamed protein product [Rhizophagus irregularis]|uniref:NAD-specific glutamate dehydrogenase second domain-containing protein n=1 Tax=Rhizophagus irregularis TaxID=588596 RepID=A0A915YVM0_9GLOM|nr:unnamed protein product [Rhizophagus irregularis]